MNANYYANLVPLCQHEPSAVFTATGGWIESYVCKCSKCGRVVSFLTEGTQQLSDPRGAR